MKYLRLFEDFIVEKKPKGSPDFHHSDAPDTEGKLLSEVNSRPKIEIEDGEMYLDYSGSTGTSSFGGLKSPVFKVTIVGPKDDPKNQKYMIYWKEDTEDWEWERGNMKRQLRNSITSYAKRYLPIK